MRGLIKCCLSVTIGLTAAFPSIAFSQDDTTISWSECHIRNVTQKAACTTIAVPLDRTDASKGTLDLFVARLPATGTEVLPDPFVILAGGPGQAASDMGMIVDAGFDQVRQGRDILLIDHRGVGRSNPLQCTEMTDTLDLDMAGAAELASRCHDTIGVDTTLFGMDAAQQDFVDVIQELGYSSVNLYGVSYGTRSASWIMRYYPDLVRSAVLDGVIAPETQLFMESPGGAQRALDALFSACESDGACNETFPSLRTDFDDYRLSLLQEPKTYQVSHPLKGTVTSTTFHHDGFVHAVRAVLYNTQMTGHLPFALDQLYSGNAGPLLALTAMGGQVGDTMSIGSTLSILCGDEIARSDAAEMAAAGEGNFTGDSYFRFWTAACSAWPHKRAKPESQTAFESDIPVLLLSGAVDPVTPSTNGDKWLKSLTNARHLVVPSTGHNAAFSGCMPKMVSTFIETLDHQSLKADCLDRVVRPAFVTSLMGPSRHQEGASQ